MRKWFRFPAIHSSFSYLDKELNSGSGEIWWFLAVFGHVLAGWRFHYSTESIWSLGLCVFCLYYDIFRNLGRVNNSISANPSLNSGIFLCSPFADVLHHWQQIMHNSHQTNAVGLEDLTFSPSKYRPYCRWILPLTLLSEYRKAQKHFQGIGRPSSSPNVI